VDLIINASWHPVRHEIDPAPIRRNNLPSLVTFLSVIKIGVPPVGLISALRLPGTTDTFRS
jgi:hypothetical protein